MSGLDGEGKIAQLLNWVKRCQAIPVLAIAHTMAEQMFLSHSGADDVILCNSSESTADSRRFSLMLQLKIKSLIRPRTVRIRSKTVPVDDIPKPVMLDKVASDVQDVAGRVDHISSVSNEQATAIAQIRESIDMISQVIQENSATAEESAASSEELTGQMQMLKRLVEAYELSEQEHK